MIAPPSLEPVDTLMASPFDLTMKARILDKVYREDGIPYPVSGDVITRGKAEWVR